MKTHFPKASTPLRYPGGKSRGKLFDAVMKCFSKMSFTGREYREPFFGGGGIGIGLLPKLHSEGAKMWINDFDAQIAALWTSIIRYPEELKGRIDTFQPTVDSFETYKSFLLDPAQSRYDPENVDTTVDLGFAKLVANKLSFSGLGVMGRVLGGKEQRSEYKVDCRWNSDSLKNKVTTLNRWWAERVPIVDNRCTSYDFTEVIGGSAPAVLYCDPPYYEKGGVIYPHSFDHGDHIRLMTSLKESPHPFVLSYDNHPAVVEMYAGWATVELTQEIPYTIMNNQKDRETGESVLRKKSELIVYRA